MIILSSQAFILNLYAVILSLSKGAFRQAQDDSKSVHAKIKIIAINQLSSLFESPHKLHQ